MSDNEALAWIGVPLWTSIFVAGVYDLIRIRIPILKEENRPQQLRINYSFEFNSSTHTNSIIFLVIDVFSILGMPVLIYLALSKIVINWVAILLSIIIISSSVLLVLGKLGSVLGYIFNPVIVFIVMLFIKKKTNYKK
jgi:hypothetical protein